MHVCVWMRGGSASACYTTACTARTQHTLFRDGNQQDAFGHFSRLLFSWPDCMSRGPLLFAINLRIARNHISSGSTNVGRSVLILFILPPLAQFHRGNYESGAILWGLEWSYTPRAWCTQGEWGGGGGQRGEYEPPTIEHTEWKKNNTNTHTFLSGFRGKQKKMIKENFQQQNKAATGTQW